MKHRAQRCLRVLPEDSFGRVSGDEAPLVAPFVRYDRGERGSRQWTLADDPLG